jgi:hypothetical protein
MKRMTWKSAGWIGLIIIGLSLAAITGCSSGSTCGSDAPVSGNIHESGLNASFWGAYSLDFDIDAGQVSSTPISPEDAGLNRIAQIDVTDYAEFGVKSANWDPITRNWTITAFLKNPSGLTGYGIWLVFTNLGDKELAGQDGFTWIEQPGGGMLRVPFLAFGKYNTLREFPPLNYEEKVFVIHWPEGVHSWPPVVFFIDASWPKERKTPMVEEMFTWHTGDDYPLYYIRAWVADFQDTSQELTVTADLTPIVGGMIQMYDDGAHNDGIKDDSKFGCSFDSEALPGDYIIKVIAHDPLNHYMENDVSLTVLPISQEPCVKWWELRKGTKCNIDWDTEFLIKSQDEFDLFLSMFGPWPNPPDIDWDSEMVMAFTWGEVMSSGYWIEMVDACWDASDVLHVRFNRWWPGSNCMVLWVIQSPYYIIKAERWDGDVVFEGEFKEDPCKGW